MDTRLNPYLSFRETASAAMNFYQSVFGGELTVSTFADFHASDEPAEQDLVMHSELSTTGGLTLMNADTPGRIEYTPGTNYSVALNGEDENELRGYWDKISVGGTISMPLEKAPWGDSFGMCVDKFGVSWLVNIYAPKT